MNREKVLSQFSNSESERENQIRKALKRLHPGQSTDLIDKNEQFNKIKASEQTPTETPEIVRSNESGKMYFNLGGSHFQDMIFDPVVPDVLLQSNNAEDNDLNLLLNILGGSPPKTRRVSRKFFFHRVID